MPADPSDPHAWVQRAYSNLRLAEKGKATTSCWKTYALMPSRQLKRR